MNDSDIEIRTYFARGKNALVARGDFSELYASWYLHRLDYGIDTPPEVENLGRDALAAVTKVMAQACGDAAHSRPDPTGKSRMIARPSH